MELKELKKDLEELSNGLDKENFKHLLFITDKEKSLLVGKFNKTDIKNMFVGLLADLKQDDRVEILNDVLKIFIK